MVAARVRCVVYMNLCKKIMVNTTLEDVKTEVNLILLLHSEFASHSVPHMCSSFVKIMPRSPVTPPKWVIASGGFCVLTGPSSPELF